MNIILRYVLFLVVALLVACENPPPKAILKGFSNAHPKKNIYLVKADYVQSYDSYFTALDSIVTDSTGFFQFEIEPDGNHFFYLYDSAYQISDCLYLTPGDSLSIYFSPEKDSLSGTASQVNQILSRIYELPFRETTLRRYLNGRDLVRLEPAELNVMIAEVRKFLNQDLEELLLEAEASEEFAHYIETYLNNWVINTIWHYLEYHKYYAHDEWGFLPVDSIQSNFLKDWIRDTTFHFISNYKRNVVNHANEQYREAVQHVPDSIRYPTEFRNKVKIIQSHLHGIEREIALNQLRGDFYMYMEVVDDFYPYLDSLSEGYQSDSQSPIYGDYFKKTYQLYQRIAPGKPAPDFTLPNLQDQPISLSDFRGKYVYMDFWGTWCWPCIESIPDSRDMQTRFKENDQIVFLNIALEYDEENIQEWKEFLQKNDFPGIHVVAEKQFRNPQLKPYLIQAAPTYILIDPEGKILQTRAKRPHEAKDNLVKLIAG
jgi:peroxiredoxin